MKKILSVLVVVALLMGLAGCGSSAGIPVAEYIENWNKELENDAQILFEISTEGTEVLGKALEGVEMEEAAVADDSNGKVYTFNLFVSALGDKTWLKVYTDKNDRVYAATYCLAPNIYGNISEDTDTMLMMVSYAQAKVIAAFTGEEAPYSRASEYTKEIWSQDAVTSDNTREYSADGINMSLVLEENTESMVFTANFTDYSK